MKTVLRLLLPVFCLMLLTACGGKQVPTREGDLPPWMGTLADLRQFPQDLNVYAKAAGPDKALLDAGEQAAQDARFNRIFFGPWDMGKTSMRKRDVAAIFRRARGFKRDDIRWSQTEWDQISRNAHLRTFPSRAQAAITVRNTDLREMPTHETRFSEPTPDSRANPFDYFQYSLLPPGTPLDAGADPYDPHSYDKYTQRTYSPDAMYDQVLEFVNANKERPFFLMWTTPIPHSPMQAPDADVQYYVRKFGDEQPIEGKGYFPSRWPRATYAAMITYFDRQIGGLVAELKRLGIWENTVIVLTSDNGPASNSCSSSEWFDSAHPFRSGKGWGKSSLREGGIRMPFIVAWGGKLRPQVSDHIGYFPDVMPTLCELAGVEPPATDGISFLPTLEGRRQPQHEYLYWEFPGSKGWVAVRWGEWKGLLRRVKEGNDRFELFNLRDDPREEHDLAAQHPEIIDRMWQFVSASHTEPANPKFRMEIGRK